MEQFIEQHLLLNEDEKEILKRSSVAIVGIGALGTIVAKLLATAGIGKITLIDRDIVEFKNLQTQKLYCKADIGKAKAIVAKEKLVKVNPEIKIDARTINLDSKNINEMNANILIDCTDNIETKFLLNEYAVKKGIPLVHGAISGRIGQLFNVIPGEACVRCIFKDSEMGCDNEILDSISNLVGTMQAKEVIKILLKKDHEKNFLRINVEKNSFEKIRVKKNRYCPVCSQNHEYSKKEKKYNLFKIEKCKTKAAYAAKPIGSIRLNLENIKKRFSVKVETPIILVLDDETVVHDYGEIVFKKRRNIREMEKIAKEIYEVGI